MTNFERKLGPKSKKALTYMRQMIGKNIWRPNEIIPPISAIAKILNMSTPTVRKALSILEYDHTIEYYDGLGFVVLSDVIVKQNRNNRLSGLLRSSLINLSIAKQKYINKKIFGSYAIGYNKNTDEIHALNIITNKSITCSFTELKEMIDHPITAQLMLDADPHLLIKLRKKYKKQCKLEKLAKVVNINKEELGIQYV